MQIEEITVELLKGIGDREIKDLRYRIMELWDRYYVKSPPMSRDQLMIKYRTLREEMVRRGIEVPTAKAIDHEVVKFALAQAKKAEPRSPLEKKLTEAEQADFDRESEVIRENKKKAVFPHKFKAASWTHPNGHPRCIMCGQEERTGGVCEKPLEKSVRQKYEESEQWDEAFTKSIERVKKELAPGTVLDVGCGSGKLLKMLGVEGRKVKGLDNDKTAVLLARGKGLDIDRKDIDAAGLAIDPDSYDNVLFVNSIEYMKEYSQVLGQAAMVAKKKVIVVSPIGKRSDPAQKHIWKTAAEFKAMLPEEWTVEPQDEEWAVAVMEKKVVKKEKFDIEKPSENEHACRLIDPKSVDILGSGDLEHEGKPYRVLYGRPKGESSGSRAQGYRYPTSSWTEAQARAHCKDHKGILFEPAVPAKDENVEKAEFEFRILKIDKKQHIVGGIVYEPRAVDSQGDWTDKTEIEEAMYGFMEKYAKDTKRIKVMHKGKPRFFPIVEVFQPDGDIKKGGQTIKAGTWWMMVKVEDNEVWELIEKGELTGFSMGGRASAKSEIIP